MQDAGQLVLNANRATQSHKDQKTPSLPTMNAVAQATESRVLNDSVTINRNKIACKMYPAVDMKMLSVQNTHTKTALQDKEGRVLWLNDISPDGYEQENYILLRGKPGKEFETIKDPAAIVSAIGEAKTHASSSQKPPSFKNVARAVLATTSQSKSTPIEDLIIDGYVVPCKKKTGSDNEYNVIDMNTKKPLLDMFDYTLSVKKEGNSDKESYTLLRTPPVILAGFEEEVVPAEDLTTEPIKELDIIKAVIFHSYKNAYKTLEYGFDEQDTNAIYGAAGGHDYAKGIEKDTEFYEGFKFDANRLQKLEEMKPKKDRLDYVSKLGKDNAVLNVSSEVKAESAIAKIISDSRGPDIEI